MYRDTVFDVEHDRDRAQAQGLEPNGFSFDGAAALGVDYALNRWVICCAMTWNLFLNVRKPNVPILELQN